MVVPTTYLLHPGREVAVGPRLLIRREIPAYFAASLYLEVIPLSATRGRAGLQLQLCPSQNQLHCTSTLLGRNEYMHVLFVDSHWNTGNGSICTFY